MVLSYVSSSFYVVRSSHRRRVFSSLRRAADFFFSVRKFLVYFRNRWDLVSSLVDVERERDPLQRPVAPVFVRGEIRLEHEPDAHGVSSALRHVHGRPERVLQFELARLNRNHLQDGQLGDEHLRVLALQHAPLEVPARALEVQTLDVRPELEPLSAMEKAMALLTGGSS